MKFFSATLLATAALGIRLQAIDISEGLKKDVLGAVDNFAKEVDADGNAAISPSEIA